MRRWIVDWSLVSLAGLLSIVLLSGCGPNIAYEQQQEVGDMGWAYADSVAFEFVIADTLQRYDLVLSIDHTTNFPYQNFYVRVVTHLPGGRLLAQPLSLQLADNFGVWYGECSGTECTNYISLQEGARFDAIGEYRIVVEQYSRDNPLAEIRGVGFRLIEVEG